MSIGIFERYVCHLTPSSTHFNKQYSEVIRPFLFLFFLPSFLLSNLHSYITLQQAIRCTGHSIELLRATSLWYRQITLNPWRWCGGGNTEENVGQENCQYHPGRTILVCDSFINSVLLHPQKRGVKQATRESRVVAWWPTGYCYLYS
jgi:hypothetical protein